MLNYKTTNNKEEEEEEDWTTFPWGWRLSSGTLPWRKQAETGRNSDDVLAMTPFEHCLFTSVANFIFVCFHEFNWKSAHILCQKIVKDMWLQVDILENSMLITCIYLRANICIGYNVWIIRFTTAYHHLDCNT